MVAALRAALVPVVLLGEQLVDHPEAHTEAFPFLLAAFAAWAAFLLALRLASARGRARPAPWLERAEPFVDLAAIVALTYASGGPFSETAMAFFVLPVLAAAQLRPGVTAAWSLGAIAAYLALSFVHPAAGDSDATARIVSQVAYLALVGAAATMVSHVLTSATRRSRGSPSSAVSSPRTRSTAEQRERRRLAGLLHDESVQTLSLARQELMDYRRTGRDDAYERARGAMDEAIGQLRGEIFELHPYVLDHAGLQAALDAIAERGAQRMGAEITVAVDPRAVGPHDELLVVIARELIANAVRHSGATHVAVAVAADPEQIELQVRDDGRGFDPAERRAAALLDGHVGLASSEQRVRSAGGELIVSSRPGTGTSVRVPLPLAG